MRRWMRAIGAAALLAGAGAPPATAQAALCTGEVTVTGEGGVTAVPDLLRVAFSAEARAESPAEAFADASARVRAVIAALEAGGVAARDVATSQISLDALRERGDGDAAPEVVAWRAFASLDVAVRELAAFGRLAEAAVEAGATGVSSARLEVSDAETRLGEARAAAVRDAIAKARAMAEAAGLALGPVLTLVEGGAAAPRPLAARGLAMAAAEAMPVAPGERTLSARVTLTAALCPAE